MQVINRHLIRPVNVTGLLKTAFMEGINFPPIYSTLLTLQHSEPFKSAQRIIWWFAYLIWYRVLHLMPFLAQPSPFIRA